MTTSSQGRVSYFDGIRALAIAGVLAVHWAAPYLPLWLGGYIGVDVFFVLSGFIITTMIWRTEDSSIGSSYLGFLRRRAKRLYPALLVMLVGVIFIYMLVPGAPQSAQELVPFALIAGIQDSSLWLASENGSLGPYGQTWSLAIEWYFYLLWPVAVFVAKTRGVSAKTVAAAAVFVGAAFYVGSLPLNEHWFYYGPTARVAELLAGASLALWLQSGAVQRAGSWLKFASVASIGGLGVYVCFGPVEWDPLFRVVGVPLAIVATCTLILNGYAGRDGAVYWLLSLAPLAFLGRVSYSLYLWHLVPLTVLDKDEIALPPPVLGVLGVASACVLTMLSYWFAEKPFLRSRSDILSATPAGATTAAASHDNAGDDARRA